jgi:hypothetical protein
MRPEHHNLPKSVAQPCQIVSYVALLKAAREHLRFAKTSRVAENGGNTKRATVNAKKRGAGA